MLLTLNFFCILLKINIIIRVKIFKLSSDYKFINCVSVFNMQRNLIRQLRPVYSFSSGITRSSLALIEHIKNGVSFDEKRHYLLSILYLIYLARGILRKISAAYICCNLNQTTTRTTTKYTSLMYKCFYHTQTVKYFMFIA